ncbi:DinB family protein [Gimesia sp.]|uniref:DinB family protein n=1 Tax=Gimesia sp. TaxID=2024833 RepID=UPI000C541A9C|nr:DinB family protein [Gimesia sp.]MAX38556.1 damage-inducible protein DinB [Gimesia sp.]HAH44669.1 damage-inducible protein DinB [Planctomycetaceae bacterium]|tara:strand:- start:3977 stop:4462 length:486 start_codon:yes stop_codon:yes gene_type:complete
MDLLNRLLGHDAWTTRQLLEICATLSDEQLDREFDIGHRSLRATLHHIICNMEIWSTLMAAEPIEPQSDQSIAGLLQRLTVAATRLESTGKQVAAEQAWDEVWIDVLDDPPREKTFGTGLAHIITHSMHHRAQLLYLLRLSGVESLPEGNVFTWETQIKRG